jgi:hypothetical protein
MREDDCLRWILFFFTILYIILATELHLKNVYYLYTASLNPTNVVKVIVLVIAWVITHISNSTVPISSKLAYNHAQDNH